VCCTEIECPSGCTSCSSTTVCTTCASGYAKKPDNTACLREFYVSVFDTVIIRQHRWKHQRFRLLQQTLPHFVCPFVCMYVCMCVVSCVAMGGHGCMSPPSRSWKLAFLSRVILSNIVLDRAPSFLMGTGDLGAGTPSLHQCRFLSNYFDRCLLLLSCTSVVFLQGVSVALLCKPCTSYDRDVRLSVCQSVRHTLALSENDAS